MTRAWGGGTLAEASPQALVPLLFPGAVWLRSSENIAHGVSSAGALLPGALLCPRTIQRPCIGLVHLELCVCIQDNSVR